MESEELNNEELKNKRTDGGFDLPEDYFSSLSGKILSKMEWQEELSEFPVLRSIQKTDHFVIPEHYFADFVLRAELFSVEKVSRLKAELHFEVDEAHFTDRIVDIEKKIELADELKEYPTLYRLDKTDYSKFTAETYFEGLREKIREKIYAPEQTSLWAKILEHFLSRKIAYSFSVVVVLVMVYLFSNPDEPMKSNSDCETLACLNKQEILKHLETDQVSLDEIITVMGDETLSDTLKILNTEPSPYDSLLEQIDESQFLEEMN